MTACWKKLFLTMQLEWFEYSIFERSKGDTSTASPNVYNCSPVQSYSRPSVLVPFCLLSQESKGPQTEDK